MAFAFCLFILLLRDQVKYFKMVCFSILFSVANEAITRKKDTRDFNFNSKLYFVTYLKNNIN